MIKVYLKTFDASGNIESSFRDITDDCLLDNIGTISEKLDQSEYQSGAFRVSDFGLTVINRDGLYGEVGSVQSIFKYKRTGSIVRVTWAQWYKPSICGFAVCGEILCNEPELTVFEGLLSDEATKESVENQNITFRVLGYQSAFDKTLAPTISVGQSFSTIISNCITAPGLTVGSIAVGINATIDIADSFENKSCKEVLDSVLNASDSVLYAIGSTIYVENRSAIKTASAMFYGQASTNGVEDIEDISDVSNGLNRVANFVTWEETALYAQNVNSVDRNGLRKKQINYEFITNDTKRQDILDSILDTLGEPKKELSITVPVTRENLTLSMLSGISIDYPTPSYAPIGQTLAIYGIAKYGEDFYPYQDFTITISPTIVWKIQSRQIDFRSDRVILGVREL